MKFREDVLDRVIDAQGIDSEHRDAFIPHASSFDHDGNNYLKQQEVEDAAAAWNEAQNEAPGASEEAEEAEEAESEDAADDAAEAETKSCPICMKDVAADATDCDCGFTFDV